ncbi:hypothetical protein [Actinomycetospora chibensis]|uniref:Uncharacterized protein n=1 Tax=Actinomycetospora chibensis TaxID=663606 RepID=A0ABV9RKW1_9PSEU|nr:hypothetical protein [Actinomycetospora chibensis]MDD7923307.1 hypothetical protein [Actinomycetospora chibensis]
MRATSRLDLAADLPLLIAWGTADALDSAAFADRIAGHADMEGDRQDELNSPH